MYITRKNSALLEGVINFEVNSDNQNYYRSMTHSTNSNKFSNVGNDRLRLILERGSHVRDIEWALMYTQNALDSDRDNEDISFKIMDARDGALSKALECYPELLSESLNQLRIVWSV